MRHKFPPLDVKRSEILMRRINKTRTHLAAGLMTGRDRREIRRAVHGDLYFWRITLLKHCQCRPALRRKV